MCPPHALQALLPGCSSTVPDKSTASQQAAAQRRSRACLCVSPAGRALLVSVAGTTSAGRLRYSRRYSMPLSVRNLNNSRNPDAAQTARQIREHHPCVQPADDVCCYSGYATRRAASRCRATQLLLLATWRLAFNTPHAWLLPLLSSCRLAVQHSLLHPQQTLPACCLSNSSARS